MHQLNYWKAGRVAWGKPVATALRAVKDGQPKYSNAPQGRGYNHLSR